MFATANEIIHIHHHQTVAMYTRPAKCPHQNWYWALLFLLFAGSSSAQENEQIRPLPLTISLFSESVSLPNFRGFFRQPNWGVRIGTEFYYRRRDNSQLLQAVQLGYYRHDGFQQGVFLSTAFGYRRLFGRFSADATIGAGYLHLITDLPRYEPVGDGYQPASQRLHKFMPTLGLGMGYRLGEVTVFSRYELFGELPFSYKGVPVLPHKTLHLGASFPLKDL